MSQEINILIKVTQTQKDKTCFFFSYVDPNFKLYTYVYIYWHKGRKVTMMGRRFRRQGEPNRVNVT